MIIRDVFNYFINKMSWIKQLPLLLILTLIFGLIVTPSFFIPWWIGQGTVPLDNTQFQSAEAKYLANLERAYHFEEHGELEAALTEFQKALESGEDGIRNVALEGIRRIDRRMNLPFSLWADLALVREFSEKARLPIVVAILVFLLIQLSGQISRLTLKPGWLIRLFPVFGSLDTNVQDSFRQLLVDHLTTIQWFYQQPSAELTQIGATVITQNFVPEGDISDPWVTALSSLREAGEKSAPLFFLEQTLSFIGGFRRGRRYVLSGSVTLLQNEANAFVELKDMRTGETLGKIKASSSEMEQFGRLSLAPSQISSRSVTTPAKATTLHSSGMFVNLVDIKEDQIRLASLAQVLACKIWYELSKGAKANFQPQSWKTVWYFVNGLQALRHNQDDPTDVAKQAYAEECFRTIVKAIDPLYHPAHFFLGLVYLNLGKIQKAQAEFEYLTVPVEKAGNRMLKLVKDKWYLSSDNRLIGSWFLSSIMTLFSIFGFPEKKLASMIGRLHDKLYRRWLEISRELYGGHIYRMVEAWEEFPDWGHYREEGQLKESIFNERLKIFESVKPIYERVLVATDPKAYTEKRKEAKETLDAALNRSVLRDFDGKMESLADRLERIVLQEEVDKSLEKILGVSRFPGKRRLNEGAAKEIAASLESLRSGERWALLPFFEPMLDFIQQSSIEGNWNECQGMIDVIRTFTRVPNEYRADSLIKNYEPPGRWAWLLNRIAPGYHEVEKWYDMYVKDRFYLESRYYLNLARYLSFEPAKLNQSKQDVHDLYEKLLAPKRFPNIEEVRREELRILSMSLEVNAAVRIVSDGAEENLAKDMAEDWLKMSIKNLEQKLNKLTKHESRDIRAASFCTLGLLQRYKNLSDGQISSSLTKDDNLIDLTDNEVRYYEQSLKQRSSASTYTYLAESLKRQKYDEEADLMLSQALKLCPQHPLAVKLQKEWSLKANAAELLPFSTGIEGEVIPVIV